MYHTMQPMKHKTFQNGCTVVPSPYLFYSSLCVTITPGRGIIVHPNGIVKMVEAQELGYNKGAHYYSREAVL